MTTIPVFAWVTGQQTNIGDSLLRRPYLRLLCGVGPTEVWVRRSSDAFLAGLDLDANTKVSRRFGVWWARALISAVRRPTLVAVNAGEVPAGHSAVVAALALTVLGRVARARGGCSVWLGGSVPAGRPRSVKLAFGMLAKSQSLVSWREADTQRELRTGTVQPDWAFSEGSESSMWSTDRPILSVVLRGDRDAPDQDWLDWLTRLADGLDLQVYTVVQVEGDLARAVHLADTLGGSCLTWPTGLDHAAQEARVRDLYSKSLITIGDRLHGLVAAATEGSIPLGWVPTSQGKIGAHFAAIELDWVGRHEGALPTERTAEIDFSLLEQYGGQLREAIDKSRRSLQQVDRRVHELVEFSRKRQSLK